EEIGLNKALENAGIQVVETDLGEYIVQIRGEAPAHIITPAVHLRRADVGKTFQEKLGIPYTEDVAELTQAARKILRQVFLSADIGISGVNFGIADQGMLCILTNEGNGRMVTTLPQVHIALMGMERIVPNLDDLALMLSLLPRSATGQKITVYTNLIRGPRGNDEIDGCPERHIILLDNGRTAMRNSPLAEALLCIRCGACLNACPVFREIGGHGYVSQHGKHTPYPGPIGSVISPALFGYPEFGNLARASTLCGACKEACPVDINLPELLLRIRAGQVSTEKPAKPNPPWWLKWGLRGFAVFASQPQLFSFAQKALRLLTSLTFPGNQWLPLPQWSGWGYGKNFPRPAAVTFQDLWKQQSTRINSIEPFPIQSSLKILEPEQTSSLEIINQKRSEDLVTRFTHELEALGGQVIQCDRANLKPRLFTFLEREGLKPALTPQAQFELISLLDGDWMNDPSQLFTKLDPSQSTILTTAQGACAETGSILICSNSQSPLSASLIPETHLVLLHAAQIVATLAELLHHPQIQNARSSVIISGPSRTADIEMTLTIGVHGPKRLVAFLIV
ncbi:MAG: LUD domain-containing protein, partial [Anaerolineales bacterium]